MWAVLGADEQTFCCTLTSDSKCAAPGRRSEMTVNLLGHAADDGAHNVPHAFHSIPFVQRNKVFVSNQYPPANPGAHVAARRAHSHSVILCALCMAGHIV